MKGTFRVSMTNKDGEQVHIVTTHEVNIDIESRPAKAITRRSNGRKS